MKSFMLVACGLIAGSVLGWVAHAWQAPDGSGGAFRKATPLHPAGATAHSDASTGTGPQVTAADFLKQSIEAAAWASRELGGAAFGEKLAELLTGPMSLEDRVVAEGMQRQLDPERFAAFYAAYSRRINLKDSDTVLNNILISMGQRYGGTALDTMLAKYPDGFERMDSLIHGWAMGNSDAATQWFNDLPESHPRYDKILQGLVWGLAAKDGPMAGQVMGTLSASDREKAMYGFSSSFIEAHGLKAFDAWAREAPSELAAQAVQQARHYASMGAPSEFVPWFAANSGSLGVPNEIFGGFNQWFAASAPAAMEWLAALPPEKSRLQSALAQHISPAELNRFLTENPQHPNAALLEKVRAGSVP